MLKILSKTSYLGNLLMIPLLCSFKVCMFYLLDTMIEISLQNSPWHGLAFVFLLTAKILDTLLQISSAISPRVKAALVEDEWIILTPSPQNFSNLSSISTIKKFTVMTKKKNTQQTISFTANKAELPIRFTIMNKNIQSDLL